MDALWNEAKTRRRLPAPGRRKGKVTPPRGNTSAKPSR
jgi:hypothetical protein